jgi:hypothetical protein
MKSLASPIEIQIREMGVVCMRSEHLLSTYHSRREPSLGQINEGQSSADTPRAQTFIPMKAFWCPDVGFRGRVPGGDPHVRTGGHNTFSFTIVQTMPITES